MTRQPMVLSTAVPPATTLVCDPAPLLFLPLSCSCVEMPLHFLMVVICLVSCVDVHADEDALFSAATNNDLGRLKGLLLLFAASIYLVPQMFDCWAIHAPIC